MLERREETWAVGVEEAEALRHRCTVSARSTHSTPGHYLIVWDAYEVGVIVPVHMWGNWDIGEATSCLCSHS